MDVNKVIEYLKANDNITKQTLLKNIIHKMNISDLVIDLLYKAENGDFHEIKKPEMIRFIRLMHLKKALMPWEYTNLGLKHLNELRQEVEILEQQMIDESKNNE